MCLRDLNLVFDILFYLNEFLHNHRHANMGACDVCMCIRISKGMRVECFVLVHSVSVHTCWTCMQNFGMPYFVDLFIKIDVSGCMHVCLSCVSAMYRQGAKKF